MTELHKILVNTLEKNRLPNKTIQNLNKTFEDVKHDLLQPINKFNPKIYKGGSFAKGTIVNNKYDLDIVLYFPPEINMSEKEIYDMMSKLLKGKGYKSKRKYGVALQITYNNIE